MTIDEIKENVKVLDKLEHAIMDLDDQIKVTERAMPRFNFAWMQRALLGKNGIIYARTTSTVEKIDIEAMKLLKGFYGEKANKLRTKLERNE